MEIIGNLRCTLFGVAQFYFDAGDEGTVYPVLGGSAAGLAYNGAEVTLGEAKTVSIVAYLVVLHAVLACQLDETIEDGLFA